MQVGRRTGGTENLHMNAIPTRELPLEFARTDEARRRRVHQILGEFSAEIYAAAGEITEDGTLIPGYLMSVRLAKELHDATRALLALKVGEAMTDEPKSRVAIALNVSSAGNIEALYKPGEVISALKRVEETGVSEDVWFGDWCMTLLPSRLTRTW